MITDEAHRSSCRHCRHRRRRNRSRLGCRGLKAFIWRHTVSTESLCGMWHRYRCFYNCCCCWFCECNCRGNWVVNLQFVEINAIILLMDVGSVRVFLKFMFYFYNTTKLLQKSPECRRIYSKISVGLFWHYFQYFAENPLRIRLKCPPLFCRGSSQNPL